MFRKRPELTDLAFQDYWARVHAPIAVQIPALRRYEQNCIRRRLPSADPTGDQTLDGLCKLSFASEEEMQGVMSPEMARVLKEDEVQFLEGLRTFVVRPVAVVAPPASEGTKCVVLVTRRPDQSEEEFARIWTAHGSAVARVPGVIGYVQNLVTARSIERQPASHEDLPVDCIDEIWFAKDMEAATVEAELDRLQRMAAPLCARTPAFVVSVNVPSLPRQAAPTGIPS
jgi:uncharacterized protein (TIGR02118 family)